MFESYRDIFNQRAESYHAAMIKYPRARESEFFNLIHLAGIEDGDFVCDVPAGGCYLSAFVQKKITLISIETSREFIRYGKDSFLHQRLLCEDIASMPLRSGSVDKVVSLAGVHHIKEKGFFYREVYRLLKKGGMFTMADVMEHSSAAKFLNGFVHEHNSMGHEGKFLNEKTKEELEQAGFVVEHNGPMNSFWKFDSGDQMADYCKMLFGMDGAHCCQIIEGIKYYLDFEMGDSTCCVKWNLGGFKAIKK